MLSGYEEINKQVCAYSDGIITKSQMEDNLEYFTSANGMSILITNSDWTTLYTNNKGEAELLLRLKMSFFNNDRFQDNSPAPSGEQEPEPVMPDSVTSDLSSSNLPEVMVMKKEAFLTRTSHRRSSTVIELKMN